MIIIKTSKSFASTGRGGEFQLNGKEVWKISQEVLR